MNIKFLINSVISVNLQTNLHCYVYLCHDQLHPYFHPVTDPEDGDSLRLLLYSYGIPSYSLLMSQSCLKKCTPPEILKIQNLILENGYRWNKTKPQKFYSYIHYSLLSTLDLCI